MAKMHTQLRGKETDGERHLYEFFAQTLPDYFHVWHNIIEPRTQKEIDMVLLHPKYGVWVIEVKDWLINQLRRIDPETCRLQMNGQEVEQRNPIRQARENHYPVRNLLADEPLLMHGKGRFEGNLLFPVHHVVVFSNMSKAEMEARDIYGMFPEHQIITADVIRNPKMDAIELENLLIEKRSPRFLNHLGLTKAQIAAINRLLNPSVELTGDEADDSPDEWIAPELPQRSEPQPIDVFDENEPSQIPDFIEESDPFSEDEVVPEYAPEVTPSLDQPEEFAELESQPIEPEPAVAVDDDDILDFDEPAVAADASGVLEIIEDDELDAEPETRPEIEHDALSDYETEILEEERDGREVFPYQTVIEQEKNRVTEPQSQSQPQPQPQPEPVAPTGNWSREGATALEQVLIDLLENNQQLLQRIWSRE